MKGSHDLIVVGASAGGIEAVMRVLHGLPADFGAAVMVVIHIGRKSELPRVLGRACKLSVCHPRDGDEIRRGTVYLAPSRTHMLVRDGHIALSRGPHENRHKPAIDPLFRSAARCYRSRLVGVILSGELDDGSAGLYGIKRRGGITVVQDPREAFSSAMPSNAMAHTNVDYCLPLAKIPPLLLKLAGRAKHDGPLAPTKESRRRLTTKAEFQVPFSCPTCNGPMFETHKGSMVSFHCEVGHAFSPESLSQAHSEALERALWIAIRTLRERVSVYQRLLRADGHDDAAGHERLNAAVERASTDVALLDEIIDRL